MLSLPFPTVGLGDADIRPIQEVYDLAKEKYAAEYEPDLPFPFNEFELFHYYVSFTTGPAIRLANSAGNFYVTFPQVNYAYSGDRHAACYPSCNETWGIAYLKKNFGHILIKPETLLDRIHDLINPIDIHFEDDKEFGKKFCVVANDQIKAQMAMTPAFRNLISNIKTADFMVEIIDNKLIISNKKIIEKDSMLDFIEFLNNVSLLF